MGKKCKKGQFGFTTSSRSDHSLKSFAFRKRKSINSAAAAVDEEGVEEDMLIRSSKSSSYSHPQSPTEPPKDYFPMVGIQSLAKELNALAESDDIDDDDTPNIRLICKELLTSNIEEPSCFTTLILLTVPPQKIGAIGMLINRKLKEQYL